jgi:uncharacterized membrane protein YdjX (TVP38/TMEM64 family)
MGLRAIILVAMAILGIAMLGIWQFAPAVFADLHGLMDGERLDMLVARAGLWGPILVVALMTLAVVASPIPSAPIALAAGAAYGHLWGTVQVVIGAELGALIAFGLARVLGHDVLRRVFGDRVDGGLLGSQTALTATVFASRLMPFVSFDMISYAAGLSRLHAWRFALRATWAVLGLGLVTGLPLLWVAMRKRPEKENP